MAIYLDYNATSIARPEAVEKMREILALPSNPSSVHSFGRAAKKHLEDARKIIAEAINAFTDEVIFTASGTEANATALSGFPDRRVIVCETEHSSVIKATHEPACDSGMAGCMDPNLLQGKPIPVDSNGIVNLGTLEAMLSAGGKPALVSVMLANNETGVIQPIAEVAALCKKHNALLHCDAAQGLSKIPVDFGALGADLITLSSQKCSGPLGAAALVIRRKLPFTPLLKGGGQELGRRAGTENVAAIAGFGVAVQKMDLNRMKQLRCWLDAMEDDILQAGGMVVGKAVERLPNTSCVIMPGVSNETQLIDFDLKGFAVSAGSACTSGRIQASRVLLAMGIPENVASCAIRVSGGWGTKEEEINAFTAAWKQTAGKLAKQAVNA